MKPRRCFCAAIAELLIDATLAAPVRRGPLSFASTSVLDGDAFDVVFLEIFAGGFRLVLVESGKARAIMGGASLIGRFGEGVRAAAHFRRPALHGGAALLGGLLGRS